MRPVRGPRLAAGLAILVAGACQGDPDVATQLGRVTIALSGTQVALENATCTWYEDSGQLLVEAGDSEGASYILLAAPLEWMGQPLPEGPGEPAELSARVRGTDLAVDQDAIGGLMNEAQTRGSFEARLVDGTPITGDWQCPEVVEG